MNPTRNPLTLSAGFCFSGKRQALLFLHFYRNLLLTTIFPFGEIATINFFIRKESDEFVFG
jgi:hypothetical protein